jgi:hypothetical protein
MQTILERATLPPAAQLCPRTAIRCHHLVDVDAGHEGCLSYPVESGTTLAVAAISPHDSAITRPWRSTGIEPRDADALPALHCRSEVDAE